MIQTHLEIRVQHGQREAALAAFKARRVFVDLSRFSAAPSAHLSDLSLKSQRAFPA